MIMTGVAAVPFTALYSFLMNPTLWNDSTFLAWLLSDTLSIAAAAGMLVATFATRSDIWIFLSVATLFLSFGIPLAILWSLVSAQTNWQLASILVSPIILIYVVTIIEFWRGRA